MTRRTGDFVHPLDTPPASGLRFFAELVAWVAGTWAAAEVSAWFALPTLIVLVGLPGIFSTRNDKRRIVVPTPGFVRVGIELLLYTVALVAPWFVWPAAVSGLVVGIVVMSLGVGIPRFLWLMKGAPRPR